MSHLLSTTNPQAAAEADSGNPDRAPAEQAAVRPRLPGVGEAVAFFPRPGELRAGRGRHAAIVTASNEETQTLDLVVIYDADDFIGQRNVPRRDLDGGMGWEPHSSELEARIDALTLALDAQRLAMDNMARSIFGDFEMPQGESIIGIVSEIEDKVEAIAPTLRPAPVAKAKAKAKAKKPKAAAKG